MDRIKAKQILRKTTEDYKKISKEFIETRIKPWPLFNYFKKYVKNADKVLDAGCGTGRLIEIFKGTNVEYLGFDTSESSIAFAKNKYSLPPPPTSPSKMEGEESPASRGARCLPAGDLPKGEGRRNFIVWDIVNMPWPFENESFDAVFMIAVFHHIPSESLRQEVLSEVRRVLKPDGKLIMTNWNLRSVWAVKKFWPEILRTIFSHSNLDRGDFFTPWKLRTGESSSAKATEDKKVFRFYHSFSLREIEKEVKRAGLTALENHYTINGERSSWILGKNTLTVVKK